MKSSAVSRVARMLLAGTLIATLAACGSSGTSSNRDSGRNAALEECSSDTTVAKQTDKSGKKDSSKDKDGNTEDNNNGGGNDKVGSSDCSPDTTFAKASTHKVQCDANWDPTARTITFCDTFQSYGVKQYDNKDKEIKDARQTVESDEGGNAVSVNVNRKAKRIEVTVGRKGKNDEETKRVATLSFTADTSGKQTFEYDVEDAPTTTTVPASSTTVAAPDTTVAANNTPDTTVPAPDTTVAANNTPDTTVPAPETTLAAPDTTVAAPDTTVAAPDTTLVGDPVPPILVPREICNFRYVAATHSIESCREFDRFSAAIYGTNGEYSGRYEAVGTTVTIPDNVVNSGGLGFAHVEVATDIDQIDVELYLGDGWLTVPDTATDASVGVELDSKDAPSINSTGEMGSAGFATDGNFLIVSKSFMVFERNGVPFRNTSISYDPTETTSWRAYLPDGFGIARLVASGVHQAGTTEWTSFVYYDPFEEISSQTVQVVDGKTGADYSQSNTDAIVSSFETDPCVNVSPVLIMTPQSPAGKNRVTVSMDADCSSSNHYMGFVVIPKTESIWWMNMSIQFSSFSSTRYTSTISNTVYMPDGDYIIIFGSVGQVSVTDYRVNGHGSRADCASAHLRVNEARKTGVLEGCTAGDFPWTALAYTNSQFSDGWGFIPVENGEVDLSTVPFTGRFYAFAIGLQGFLGWSTQVTPLMACVTSCGAPEPAPGVTIDQSQFNTTGMVTVTNTECTKGYWNGGAFWHQYRPNYAYEWAGVYYGGEASVVPYAGKGYVDNFCEGFSEETGYTDTNSIVAYDLKGSLPDAPANDDYRDAIEVPVNQWVNVSNVNSTVETGEPTISWAQNFAAQPEASVWYKFTATKDAQYNVFFDNNTFDSNWQVFRGSSVKKLGYVTGTYCLTFLFFGECINDLSFGAKAGNTYYVRVSGSWWKSQGYADMQVTELTEPEGSPDTTVAGSFVTDTTVAGSDTTVAGTDTTVAANNVTDTTAPRSTDTTAPKAPDTTVAANNVTDTTAPRSTDTTAPKAPDTTVAANNVTDTTAPRSTDTTAPKAPDTTVAGDTDQETEKNRAINEIFDNAAKDASKNENARVIAPEGSGDATVEVREDTNSVEIPVVDLYAALEDFGKVSKADGVRILSGGRRPVMVAPGEKSVRLPATPGVTDFRVIATDDTGKTVAATIQVKRVLKPVFRTGGSPSSNTALYAGIGAALLALLVAFYFARGRKEEEGATGQA